MDTDSTEIVWDVQQAIDWCKKLAKYNLWFIEEPTAP
jgi:L-fuconate dehydratase